MMFKRFKQTGFLCFALVFLFYAVPGHADDNVEAKRATREEAIAIVKRAIAYFKENGPDKTFAAINDPHGQFVDRDLWVFVYNSDFYSLASGRGAPFVHKDRLDEQDADGKYINREKQALAKEHDSFWQDIKFSDPLTHKLRLKHTYCEVLRDPKMGQLVFGSGYFDPIPTP